MMWQNGYLQKEKTAGKNNADSFKDKPWGAEAGQKLLPRAQALSEDQWDDIFQHCEAIVEARRGTRKATTSAGVDAVENNFDDDFDDL